MKPLTISLKDALIQFRDLRALMFMLAAPLVIALIMGAAFGGQHDGASPIANIPVAVVNADKGALGQAFVDALADIEVETAEGVQPLFAVKALDDLEAARAAVERGDLRGALYLPPDFSTALQNAASPVAVMTLYTDPTASVSPAILRSVTLRIAQGFESVALGGQLAVQLSQQAVQANPSQASVMAELSEAIEAAQQAFAADAEQNTSSRIRLQRETLGAAQEFDILGYFMPSMAIFFLMFSMFASTRSILEEETRGTLARLLTTPTRPFEILLGKIGGALLSGCLQMTVLVSTSALLFGVNWGALPGVALMTLATVAAAGGLGALVASLARDATQANIIGTLIALVFGVLGGNFIVMRGVPPWLDTLSKLTLNRWALDGFTALTLDQARWQDILPNLSVLLAIATITFALALPNVYRRFVR